MASATAFLEGLLCPNGERGFPELFSGATERIDFFQHDAPCVNGCPSRIEWREAPAITSAFTGGERCACPLFGAFEEDIEILTVDVPFVTFPSYPRILE
jgi:hypothetical protein